MSSHFNFKIPKTSDARLDEVFRTAAQKWQFNEGVAELVGGIQAPCGFRSTPSSEWKQVVDANKFITQALHTTYGSLNVTFYRGGQAGRQEEKSPFYDEIGIQWTGQSAVPSPSERIDITGFLQESLLGVRAPQNLGPDIPAQSALHAIHNEILTRLESVATNALESINLRSLELDADLNKRKQKLEDDYSNKEASLREAFEREKVSLGERESQLQKRIADVDARDNTIVRREIRDGMLREAKERIQHFELSEGTRTKRAAVRTWLLATLLVVLAIFSQGAYELWRLNDERQALQSIPERERERLRLSPDEAQEAAGQKALASAISTFQATHDPSERYWLWARLAATSAGFVLLLLYLVKWENAWASRHADAEFQLQQFHLDVNRASWVIESCLEWKKETGNAPIPRELLSAITKHLFDAQEQNPTQPVLHPADELASAILGSAKHLKLKTDGAEIDFNQPGKALPKKVKSAMVEETR